MRLLLIHQNFPGQFKRMAAEWARRPGWEVIAIGRDTAPGLPDCPELKLLRYKPHRPIRKDQHHYLRRMEDAVLHGQAVARILLNLKKRGWKPDAILAHSGWGETLYAKDVFPDTRLVHYCEWFYNAPPNRDLSHIDRPDWPYADIGFDPEFPASFDDYARIRSWNALHLLNLHNCDAGISPTQWQKAQHPAEYRHKITVAHEGIDTENLGPDPAAQFKTPSGITLKANDAKHPVLTYVARNLEPYRGFHTFMRALPAIQKEHKGLHTLIVGGNDVSYGSRPKDAKNWKEKMLAEVDGQLDPARTHFLGKLSYADYQKVLQVSSLHTYLSYPFVLSWSMLESMASGCLVLGSDTAPVREAIREGETGLLVRPLNPNALAERACKALAMPDSDVQAITTRAMQQIRERWPSGRGRWGLEEVLGCEGTSHR
ncbi:MAG: glycosyltransferase family 4 protein [Inhella sp.]